MTMEQYYVKRTLNGNAAYLPTNPPEALASSSSEISGHNEVTYDPETRRFTSNGEQLTLIELLYKVTSKTATTAKKMLAMTAQNLDDANNNGQRALEWRDSLAALDTGTGDISRDKLGKAIAMFQEKYGVDPKKDYGIGKFIKNSGSYTKDDIEKMSKATESYISTVSNNQSKINLDVERYTHVVTEANQLTASVDKSISDVLSSISSKMG